MGGINLLEKSSGDFGLGRVSPEFQALIPALSAVHGISCLMFRTNKAIQSHKVEMTRHWENEQQLRRYKVDMGAAHKTGMLANIKRRIKQSVFVRKLEKA